MAQKYTKKLIMETVLEMLEEEPLNKITIQEIAGRCKINRNTFYYYFSDIYGVIQDIFTADINRIVKNNIGKESWEEGFKEGFSLALQSRKAIYHVYSSMHREEVENYAFEIAGRIMDAYISELNREIQAAEEDVHTISYFYQCALAMMLLRWLSSGMEEEVENLVHQLSFLFSGNIEASLKRSKNTRHFR